MLLSPGLAVSRDQATPPVVEGCDDLRGKCHRDRLRRNRRCLCLAVNETVSSWQQFRLQ